MNDDMRKCKYLPVLKRQLKTWLISCRTVNNVDIDHNVGNVANQNVGNDVNTVIQGV